MMVEAAGGAARGERTHGGQATVPLADAAIQKGESVAVTVDHDEPGEGHHGSSRAAEVTDVLEAAPTRRRPVLKRPV